MANRCFIKLNGQWQSLTPTKKVNGQFQRCPVYKKENGQWVRIDQQLVTKTEIITGYAQWNGSFRNGSGTGNASATYSPSSDSYRLYQGRYSNYYHLGVMCFNDLFARARSIGTIIDVRLKLRNLHSYYNSGLQTNICGAWNMPSSKPSDFSFNNCSTSAYASNIHFVKGGAEHKSINLNNAINDIQNNQINGFRLLSPTGFDLNNYGYFDGTSSTRPYIEIIVQYQVWE